MSSAAAAVRIPTTTMSECGPHRAHAPDNGFDVELAKRIANFFARRMVRSGAWPAGEFDDAASEMITALVEGWPRFNPTRAGQTTYMSTVMRHRAAALLRARRSAKRGAGRCRNMTDLGVDTLDVFADRRRRGVGGPGGTEEIALRLDVQAIVGGLPGHLQRTCALLMRMSPTEAARELGIPRHRLHAQIREIRRHFVAAGWEGSA